MSVNRVKIMENKINTQPILHLDWITTPIMKFDDLVKPPVILYLDWITTPISKFR